MQLITDQKILNKSGSNVMVRKQKITKLSARVVGDIYFTLRNQKKWYRSKILGKDSQQSKNRHIWEVFENKQVHTARFEIGRCPTPLGNKK